MAAIAFTRAALRDLAEALDWYDKHAPGIGSSFVAEIRAVSTRVADNRKQFPIVFADVRGARLHRFPYRLMFREIGSSIRVIAVFHTSRDPRRWRERQ